MNYVNIKTGCFDYEQSQRLSLRLIQGETVDRKEIGNYITGIQYFLREYKNNALLVLRQLKEF
jgi:hypothetical protein